MTSVAFFELMLALLGAAVALSLAATWLRIPPAAALVVGGMVLALVPQVPSVTLDPDLILVLFLPPLLLASAYQTVWPDFSEMLRPILFLSIGAVFATTALVGLVAHWVMPTLPWAAAFTLGAIVSPPDAVAAKAVLQRLKLPRRLVTVLEGESLVNDASGLVLYKFAVAAVLTGSFSAGAAAFGLVWLSLGGIAFGLACGYGANAVIRRLKDSESIISLTFIVTWADYIAAEHIGVSAVLAVVACGGVISAKSHETFRADTRVPVGAVWQFTVAILEALVFVLIGLALRGVLARHGGEVDVIRENWALAVAVTLVVVVSRFVFIFAMSNFGRLRLRRREQFQPPPARVKIVLGWAGMRGVVTLAAALALPLDFPHRDAILFSAFAVILFTVLVQGTTLGPLISRLKWQGATPMGPAQQLDMMETREAIYGAARDALQAITADEGGAPRHPQLIEEYSRRVRAISQLRSEGAEREAGRVEHFAAALNAVATSRSELIRLHRTRKIHESVLRILEDELDMEELRLRALLERTAVAVP